MRSGLTAVMVSTTKEAGVSSPEWMVTLSPASLARRTGFELPDRIRSSWSARSMPWMWSRQRMAQSMVLSQEATPRLREVMAIKPTARPNRARARSLARRGVQGFVPIHAVPGKGPIRREPHFEQLDVLRRRILEQFPGNALHYRRRSDALLRYTERFQHGGQVLELRKDLHMGVQGGHLIRRELQSVLPCDVNNRRRANGPFEVAMQLDFWQPVVFGVKAFHKRRQCCRAPRDCQTQHWNRLA